MTGYPVRPHRYREHIGAQYAITQYGQRIDPTVPTTAGLWNCRGLPSRSRSRGSSSRIDLAQRGAVPPSACYGGLIAGRGQKKVAQGDYNLRATCHMAGQDQWSGCSEYDANEHQGAVHLKPVTKLVMPQLHPSVNHMSIPQYKRFNVTVRMFQLVLGGSHNIT